MMKRFGRILVSSRNRTRIRRRPREDCSSKVASISSRQQPQPQPQLDRSHHTLACHGGANLVNKDAWGSVCHRRWCGRRCGGLSHDRLVEHNKNNKNTPPLLLHHHHRRWFTGETTTNPVPPPSASSDMLSVYRQTTERLLDTPIGTMDQKLWAETRMTILWWLASGGPDEKTTKTTTDTTAASYSRSVASESIRKALQLLDRMYHEEQQILEDGEGRFPDFFDHELLNLVLNRWRLLVSSRELVPEHRDGDDDGDSDRESEETGFADPRSLLERLHNYQETSPNLQPNTQSYAMIIDTIASLVESYDEDHQLAEKEDLMAKVDEIVDWLVDLASRDYDKIRVVGATGEDEPDSTTIPPDDPHEEGPQDLHCAPAPNVVLFSSAMNAWTKSGLRGAADRVEDLLDRMVDLQEWYPEWDIAPNKFSYSTAIDAWAKEQRVDKVRELLRRMHQHAARADDPALKPGLPAFNGYLVALAKSGRVEEAEDLLSQMEDLYDSGELEDPPSVISYTTVIDGFARSKAEGASMRAESFLRRMMDRDDLSPNAVTYNSVINAHVQSYNIEAAEILLREMHETFLRTGNMDIRPTMQSYSVVISGIARSRRKDAGERAERILEQIQNMSRSGDLDKPPDLILYNTVLNCWAKSSATPERASRAVAFLEKMRDDKIVPDVITYNTIIHCLVQSGRASEAELMLDQMKETGVYPNSITYNTLLAAYTNRKGKNDRSRGSRGMETARAEKLFEKMRNDPNITPDVVTYNTMLNAYSRQGAIENAEALLKEMLQEDSSVSPDSTSINTVISAWTKSGRKHAPQRAEAILEQMLRPDDVWNEGGKPLGIRPTSITFNSVMSAWTKTRRPEAAERCRYLFELMTNNEVARIHPDFVTFNIMIHAWSLSNHEDAPEHAEALLREMHDRVKAGNARMRPNTKTYGSLINVWSRSRRPEAGLKAEEHLRTILRISEGKQNTHREHSRSYREEQPRVFEFTSTIRAWHNSGDPIAPYRADVILHLLLEQVKKGNKQAIPDAKLFGSILQTLASSEIPDKHVYADRILSLMIEHNIGPNEMLVDLLLRCISGLKKQSVASIDSSKPNAFDSESIVHEEDGTPRNESNTSDNSNGKESLN